MFSMQLLLQIKLITNQPYQRNLKSMQRFSRLIETRQVYNLFLDLWNGCNNRQLKGCFLCKTSLTKNFQRKSRRGVGGGAGTWARFKLCYKTCVPQVKSGIDPNSIPSRIMFNNKTKLLLKGSFRSC